MTISAGTQAVGSTAGLRRFGMSLAAQRKGRSGDTGVLTLFFGVILPVFVLCLEAAGHLCGAMSFDPIPTWWHVALVALVPVANGLVLLALWSGNLGRVRALSRLNAAAVGVSLWYAVACSVLAPLMLVGMLVCGLGVIPLAPALSLVVGLVLRRRLLGVAAGAGSIGLPRVWLPACAALAALCVLSAPGVITRLTAEAALADPGDARAMRALREYGSNDELLKLCFQADRPLAPSVMLGQFFRLIDVKPPRGVDRIPWAEAQKLYYRVTGVPYEAVAPPDVHFFGGNAVRSLSAAGSGWDFDQGGDAVAARVGGLGLEGSAYRGTIDADAGLAYMEWVLIFRNDSEAPAEARARIALPPGGVVSRLTLWINGEEREAAYNAVGKVAAAYKSVVARRRDPVLARYVGRDRVLVQCFPVPAAGTMKTRIGITAPLTLVSHGQGVLRLPYFEGHNFSIPVESGHQVELEARNRIATMVPRRGMACRAADGEYLLRGALMGEEVARPFSIRVSRRDECGSAWTGDHREGVGKVIIQRIIAGPYPAPEAVIMVLDGSRRMSVHRERIARTIACLPDGVDLCVMVAGDRVVQLNEPGPLGRAGRRELAAMVGEQEFEGGCDNVAALAGAHRMALRRAGTAVFWLHAAQPLELAPAAGLVADWASGRDAPRLYDIQLDSGPSIVSTAFEDSRWFERVPGFGDPDEHLMRVSAIVTGGDGNFSFERECITRPLELIDACETSSHLARLWAYDRVLELTRTGAGETDREALRLAAGYRLVTPVSGAVVLEAAEQYREAGLDPVSPESVPNLGAVPEPGTWALVLAGGFVMALVHLGKLRSGIRRNSIPAALRGPRS